jgi:hypothetical protein
MIKKYIQSIRGGLLIWLLAFSFGQANAQQFCQAGFSYNIDPNGIVTFTDSSVTSSGTISYFWDFGNGQTATVPNPIVPYGSSGVYSVCLTIWDQPLTCSDTLCISLAINLGGGCNFGTQIQAVQNNTMLITNNFGGTAPYSYQWSTGDTTSSIQTMGISTYCVTITDAAGCTAQDCITLNPNCQMMATIAYDSLANTLTAFQTLGTAPFTYSWNTGATTQTITPTNPAPYCVIITDALGCTANACYTLGAGGCNYGFTYTYQGPGQVVFITYGTGGQMVNWDFGNGNTITSSNSTLIQTFPTNGVYNVCMEIAGCAPSCQPVQVFNGAGNSTICGTVFNDSNGNAVIDGTETGMPFAYVFLWGNGVQQTALSDSSGNYSFNNLSAGTYTVQFCTWQGGPAGGNGIITVPLPDSSASCATYTVTISANDTICGNNFGFFNNTSYITGHLFIDANANGIFDAGEFGISGQAISVGNTTVYTNGSGFYSAMVVPGTYSVSYTPSGFYSAGTLTTAASYSVNVANPGTTYSNNNFGLDLPPGITDLGISINPHTTVTPGFPAWYSIYVCNNGATPTGANVTMVYSTELVPSYQTPSGNVNAATNTITWTIPNINPGSCTNIFTNFNALVGITLGASTLQMVMVTPTSGTDSNPANDVDTVHQTIVGSWDPNNKIVTRTNTNDPAAQMISAINPDQELKYTVNFQNTGNAPAYNVIVVDEISTLLDMSTYQFLGASHPDYEIIITGNTVTYKFMNIMLPDSTNDEPNSHGHVSFRIHAFPGLTTGTQIIDYANIYFDFNDPVLTDDAVVTMIEPLGNAPLANSNLNAFPNPANDNLSLIFNSHVAGIGVVRFIDNLGRVSLQSDLSVSTGVNRVELNTASLSNGIYLMQFTTPSGKLINHKVSVQH